MLCHTMSRSPYVTSKESSHDTKPTQLVNSSDNMVQVTAQLLRERASPSDSGSQVDLHLCQLNSVPPFKQLLESESSQNPLVITSLNLNTNLLSASLSNLGDLKDTLTSLNLSRNMINRCDALQACNLRFLTSLDLSNNQLSSLEGLGSLTKLQVLDISMNRVTSLVPISTLIELTSLRVIGNKLSNFDGLDTCSRLQTLHAQRNCITSIQTLALLPHLRSLLLSDNQIAEWVPTRASLKCLGELTELSLSGNPLASDADYKMLLLSDCSSLVSLDAAPVRSYLREQVKVASDIKSVAAVASQVSTEYLNRIEMERRRAELQLTALKMQQRAVEEAFQKYQTDMEAELSEVVRFLNRVGDDRKPEDDWYRSPEGLRAWQDELKRAADYRRNQPSESDIEAAAALERRQELVQLAKQVPHAEKMYRISLTRPDLWRRMKERELAQRQQEERQIE